MTCQTFPFLSGLTPDEIRFRVSLATVALALMLYVHSDMPWERQRLLLAFWLFVCFVPNALTAGR